MEPVSLKKVCAVVAFCTTGAFLVNANEAPKQPELEKVKEAKSAKKVTFDQLLKTNDSDKNGLLSQKELENVLDTGLLKAFNDIDSNADQAISADEFATYVGATAKN
ncbi:EF-hand domain-containing protein [Thalassotalea sediminis]|uniref:EF-hand domain-containing protein n=1 Tax=Thalassotalea sediminis TaxID=1759089 RepID=UPI0025724A55|nr:EF-hand domain-containing protein [Thalassotalea sediminis]